MKNPTEMLKQIKNVLGIELSEVEEVQASDIKLEQMPLENGTVLEAEAFEPEMEVFIVSEDEKIPVPAGEYTMEDGKVMVVENEGIIKEIKEGSEEEPKEEEVVEEEMSEEVEVEFASKEEVSELRAMLEEIKSELQAEAELKAEVQEEVEELKEELSEPAAQPLKHSPESKQQAEVQMESNRPMSTADRVLQRIANIKK
jgi:cysteinyl-tRNA synthetase